MSSSTLPFSTLNIKPLKVIKNYSLHLFFILLSLGASAQNSISISYNTDKEKIDQAAKQLQNRSLEDFDLHVNLEKIGKNTSIKVFTQDDIGYWTSAGISLLHYTKINSNGFAFKWSAEKKILFILALDSSGAASGLNKLAEKLAKNNDYFSIDEAVFNQK